MARSRPNEAFGGSQSDLMGPEVNKMGDSMATEWTQQFLTLPGVSRGCHLVTNAILQGVPEISEFRVGWMNVFIQHTSASLTINENADPDVRHDFETALNYACPESLPFTHTMEGPDDMPAHVKSSMMGHSVTVPIHDGRPALGTWQGIYLCEHRDRGGPRHLVITICGEKEPNQ